MEAMKMSKRLMMSEEECRKRIKELLQIPKEDLLTNYMFQEQEINRLNNIINELEKYLKSNFWNDDEGNESYQIEKYTTYYSVYNKLKELKESGNNE